MKEGSACKIGKSRSLGFGLRGAQFCSAILDTDIKSQVKTHQNSRVFFATSRPHLILTPNTKCNNQQKSSTIQRFEKSKGA